MSERIEILNEVAARNEPASHWTGNYVRYYDGKVDTNTASISVLGLRTRGLYISGRALWYGPNASMGQVNDGAIERYTSPPTPGGAANFDDSNGCTAHLQLHGNVLEVTNESGCDGLNVTFDGQYRRK